MNCDQTATPEPVDLLRDVVVARGLAVLTLQVLSLIHI